VVGSCQMAHARYLPIHRASPIGPAVSRLTAAAPGTTHTTAGKDQRSYAGRGKEHAGGEARGHTREPIHGGVRCGVTRVREMGREAAPASRAGAVPPGHERLVITVNGLHLRSNRSLDNQSTSVDVHSTPNADGSNPGRGWPADADGAGAQALDLSAFCCGLCRRRHHAERHHPILDEGLTTGTYEPRGTPYALMEGAVLRRDQPTAGLAAGGRATRHGSKIPSLITRCAACSSQAALVTGVGHAD
jgi:hypothetical protein